MRLHNEAGNDFKREAVQACPQGEPTAQATLGTMYYKGDGVTQDFAEAIKWYRLAANYPVESDVQGTLGTMYLNWQGVVQDYKESNDWYRLAAEQGNANAQINLGSSYERGLGVLQDYVKAHALYNMVAAQGWANAQQYRDNLANKMTPDQIAKAQQLATRCIS